MRRKQQLIERLEAVKNHQTTLVRNLENRQISAQDTVNTISDLTEEIDRILEQLSLESQD